MELDTVLCCDWTDLFAQIPGRSIDLIFVDPPYDRTNLDFEQRIDWPLFWSESRRVLKSKNNAVLSFSQQPFTTDLINTNRKGFRYEIILEKTMPTGFLDAKRRPLRCHENLLIFGDGRPFYFPEMGRAETLRAYVESRAHHKRGTKADHYSDHERRGWQDNGTRYPRDVWKFAQRNTAFGGTTTLHPTQKPLAAVEKAIRIFTQPGWLVLDCFCGSGTTAVACKNTGRHFFCGDNQQPCVDVTNKRLQCGFEPPTRVDETSLDDLPLFSLGDAT